MNWKNKKVLITGAGGFIGSHLAEKMVCMGAKTRIFIRYNSRNDWGMIDLMPCKIRDRIEVVAGDLKDADAVRKAVKGMDIVFHLGALIGIPYSYVHPRDVVETNIMGTFNVLDACREFNVEKVVHTSTSEVYGTAQYVPIDEKHPLQGQSPYSASKIGADKIAESFYRSYDLPVATIRPFNTYGPRQSARAIIPTIITQTLERDRIVILGSLSPTRDFTYVDDVVNGFIRTAECKKSVGEVINIGSGFEISIGELAKKIIKIMGKKMKIISEPERIRPVHSEVERLLADISKARKLFKWEPVISLEEGLKRTVEWVKREKERYKTKIYNV